jgi:hypothetical protein
LQPVVLATELFNTENYPTTLIAAGAYTPEVGYEALDMSMPSYTVGNDALLGGSAKMEVVTLSPEKEAERAANAKVQAAKKAKQEVKRAEKQAANEAKQAANAASRASQPGAAEKEARVAKAVAAREAKRQQAEEADDKPSVVDNMKRMYGR